MKKLNTSKETAILLNVSESTLRIGQITGTLLGVKAPKFLKIGRSIRYTDTAINEWIDSIKTFEY